MGSAADLDVAPLLGDTDFATDSTLPPGTNKKIRVRQGRGLLALR